MTAAHRDSIIAGARHERLKLTLDKNDTARVEKRFGHRFTNGLRKVKADPTLFYDKVHEHTPQVVFILLPAFALLLKLIYIRSKRFYVEHLVFSFYFHSYVFFVLLVITLIQSARIGGISENADIVFLAIPVNLYFGMLRVYRQRKGKTFAKFSLLIIGYCFVLFFAMAVTLYILISSL